MISSFRRLAKSERIGWFHGLISPCGRSRIPLFDRTSYSLKRFGNGNYLKDGTLHIWKDICISHFSSCAFSSQWSVTSLVYHNTIRWQSVRFRSDSLVTLNTKDHVARFSIGRPNVNHGANSKAMKKPLKKKSRKAKLNELKWFRLKAKKKMKSPNPEVRIRYKLEKAKRKEVWLIEKLRKYEIPKGPLPVHDPEILTKEEKFYLKRTGEKKNNYVPVGRRGLFGGVVLNMHMHWKKHETVKVVCKPCRPGQIHEYAEELARLSKGMVIDIKAKNTIIFYRGKNYVQPDIMSPPDTLSKQKGGRWVRCHSSMRERERERMCNFLGHAQSQVQVFDTLNTNFYSSHMLFVRSFVCFNVVQALEKYKFEQSLEHTSQFIEKLERQLEEYHKHVELYQKNKISLLKEQQQQPTESVVSDNGQTVNRL